ncbi:serine hydrolase domain-containing protein [Undibacterium sp. TJN25]|uniref:serine hydrolase domain-containing protein n=1 Tax=Undibacterium sp. TJN25 TaxID=3413056 RepID=UPI003BF44264
MTLNISRRHMLKAASLAAVSSLAGLAGARAFASPSALLASPLAGGAAANAGAGMGSRNFASINQLLNRAVSDGVLAGVVAMGATDKGIIYEGAFGKRDAARGPAMSLDTVFWLASMTKAITATACMQLVEQGKLQLDQPMGQILPELASPQVLEGFDSAGKPRLRPAKRLITLRHLLTHTSGYTYSVWSDKLVQYEKATGMPDIAESKNGAFSAPLEFDPGERWQYGISMDWVGKIVEAVSDQSLEVYFRENIFTPLGMKDTGFLISSEQKRRLATTYNRTASGGLQAAPFEFSQRPEFFMGGGGLFSTPRDYMAFLQMLLLDGSFNGAQILKPQTVALMRQNQIGELQVVPLKSVQPAYSQDADLFPGMVQKWGLSFDINTQPGPAGRSAGSISWAGLLNCYFWLDPVKRVTGTVFTQVLPFYDPAIVKLYAGFERGLYDALAHG